MTAEGTSGREAGAMRLRGAGVVVAAVLGILLAAVLYGVLRSNEEEEIRFRFRLDAEDRIRGIRGDLVGHVDVVRAVRAFYEGSTQGVERDEFHSFTAAILRHHASVEALEWAPVVTEEERADYEKHITIRDPDSGAPVRSARPWYAPITYVARAEKGADRRGVDLAAIPVCRDTMLRACDSGDLAVHPWAPLHPGDGSGECGLLAAAAVYDVPGVPEPEVRSEHLKGFVIARVRLKTVVDDVLDRFEELGMALTVRDSENRVLHNHAVDASLANTFLYEQRTPVAGALLEFECTPPWRYVNERRTPAPLVMGLAVLVVVGVGVAYLYLLTRHADRVERLVRVRTKMIREVSRLQQAILDGAPYTIVSTDLEGTIRTFNLAAERMLGYRAEEVVDKEKPAIFHRPDEVGAYAAELADRGIRVTSRMQALLAIAASGEIDVHEWTFVRKDRTEFPVSLSVTALRDEAGAVTGYLGMAEDITERKQAEMALVAAKTAAEEASRTKSRFLANMSHELRTPLNAIIGYAEMLEEDAVAAGKPEIAADLRRITAAARHLLQLINDVLDLSKIEAGRIDIHDEPVALDRLIGEVTGTVSQMVADNANTLEATCDPAIGVMVTDATRVRQILFNLLSNAAKFTTDGSVRVRAVLDPEPPAHVVITVEDTGIGMRAAQLARIFQPFAQADGSTTRKYGGTGLGLAICREFCRLMNGSISVESEPNVGSTFKVRLPYHRGTEPAS